MSACRRSLSVSNPWPATFSLREDPDGLYRTNIQIAELNALNACLAVVKFKQLRGFYLEGGTRPPALRMMRRPSCA